MCLMQKKMRQGRWKKKNKTKKGMVETNMEVAGINKQITIVRVG